MESSHHANRRIVVAVTGASGAAYARRLVQCLVDADAEVHLVVTPYGQRLFKEELGINKVCPESILGRTTDRITNHPYQDTGSVLASGSFQTDAMIVCPCSSNTLGAIASGLGSNLVTRAAAVTLKERRRLILALREMPISSIDLGNALRLSEAGAIICPMSPGFYFLPKTVDDLIDFVVARLLDLMAIPHNLSERWTGRTKR